MKLVADPVEPRLRARALLVGERLHFRIVAEFIRRDEVGLGLLEFAKAANDRIDFAVSDEVIRDGSMERGDGERESAAPMSPWVNALATRLIQRRVVTEERLLAILRCIECEGTDLQWTGDRNLACKSCGRVYARVDGCLDLRPRAEHGRI